MSLHMWRTAGISLVSDCFNQLIFFVATDVRAASWRKMFPLADLLPTNV